MRRYFVIALLFFVQTGFSQVTVSIDSISGFSCFDTITELNVWQTHKVYFPDSSLKEDIRFRIWGKGCLVKKEQKSTGDKCFFKFQRQSYFEENKIQEKEGAYGWFVEGDSKLIYQLMTYNRKGRLLYVEKVKNR